MFDGSDTFAPPRDLPAVRPRPALGIGKLDIEPAEPHVGRVQLDGKYFIRNGRRFRAHGVTYGPFEPSRDGHPFPSRDRVREDFFGMRDAGINAARTYHVPPQWLF